MKAIDDTLPELDFDSLDLNLDLDGLDTDLDLDGLDIDLNLDDIDELLHRREAEREANQLSQPLDLSELLEDEDHREAMAIIEELSNAPD